jgi:hypothetical protein
VLLVAEDLDEDDALQLTMVLRKRGAEQVVA